MRGAFCPFLGVRAAAKALYDEDDLGDETDRVSDRTRISMEMFALPKRRRLGRSSPRSSIRARRTRTRRFPLRFFALWIGFLCASAAAPVWAVVGWAWYMFMVCHVAFIRNAIEHDRGIYGNGWEDLFASVCMYPAIVSQLELHAAGYAGPPTSTA